MKALAAAESFKSKYLGGSARRNIVFSIFAFKNDKLLLAINEQLLMLIYEIM